MAFRSGSALPPGEKITRNSSLQTYFIFKLLADKTLSGQSFDGYAYFRWLDDEIDLRLKTKADRLALIRRQKQIIASAYANKQTSRLTTEEQLIVDLIATNRQKNSKLGSFIFNFLQIIEFDAQRQGTLTGRSQLSWYTRTLAIAVTDCIEYFINHDFAYPHTAHEYDAATGAHITHMLRDYHEDLEEGYFNIPKEYLEKHHLRPEDVDSVAFHSWVKGQIKLARQYFQSGLVYWSSLPTFKSKLAAYLYYARFKGVLDTIERDQYVLRKRYSRKKNLFSYLNIVYMACSAAYMHLFHRKAGIAL